jgi:hypothetical protein
MYTYDVDYLKNKSNYNKYSQFFITLRGVFLALILFCASFLAPYLGCNYQSILKTNIYVRHLLLFFVIYFSINLVDPNIEKAENPIYSITKSFFVYSIFLLLNSIDISAIVIMIILFALLVLTSQYYNYFTNMKKTPRVDTILKIINIIHNICNSEFKKT